MNDLEKLIAEGEAQEAVEFEDEIIISPVRSAAGNIRNLAQMRPEKWLNTANEVKYDEGMPTRDPDGYTAFKAEALHRNREGVRY